MLWTLLVSVALTLTSWSSHAEPTPPAAASLFARGSDWPHFVANVRIHADLWHRDTERTPVSFALVDRLARTGHDLRLLVVAEDWCTDSANTIPFVAQLASRAGVELRVLDRTVGAPLMTRHPSADGRGVTPLVVFIRGDRDAGAWVERPRPLQEAFRRMADDPASHHRAAERQSWYDADQGRTALEEIRRRRRADGCISPSQLALIRPHAPRSHASSACHDCGRCVLRHAHQRLRNRS